MAIVDIEVGLSEEQRSIRDTARKFADEVLRPAGIALDRLVDPAQVIAADSLLWKVFERYRELGFSLLESGALELPPIEAARARFLVAEEFGRGDAGLAIGLGVADLHRTLARLSGRPALIERFCGDASRDIGCWAVTEPEHGSDTLAVSEPSFRDPSLRAGCVARKDGADWIIQGQKAAWVSNGTIATVATLFCTIDPSHGFAGGGICVVPLDLPGISRGKPLDKLGQRSLNQGEIFFDAVRLPGEYMIVGADAYAAVLESILAIANASMGAIFVGVAQAALELALDYSRERIQGGGPIIQHQSVRARLFHIPDAAHVSPARRHAR